MIGSGFVIGPAAGLAGIYLAGPLGGEVRGMLVAMGPVLAVCCITAAVTLARAGRSRRTHPGGPAPPTEHEDDQPPD